MGFNVSNRVWIFNVQRPNSMMGIIRNTQWQYENIVYISGYGPHVTHIFLFSIDIPSLERKRIEN